MPRADTSLSAILIVILCTFFTAFGQLFWKLGADQLTLSGLFTNTFLLAGFASYAVGGFFLIIALKKGELSVLYPFISLGFIWVSLLSIFFLRETMTLANWMGVAAIIGGVSLIGWGRDHG